MSQRPIRSLTRPAHRSLPLHTAALLASAFGLVSCNEAKSPTDPNSQFGAIAEGYRTRGEVRIGYIYSHGEPLKIRFEVHGTEAVIEGDILLGPSHLIATSPEQLRAAPRHVPGGPSFGIVIDGSSYRWPGGVVPYEIDPALANTARITDAITKIEAATPSVNLVPRSGQADYVRFVPSTGCSSYIGKIGGMQPINLADNCSTGNTMHEITHALGMYHEQSRCDRDSYVQILYANIQAGYEHNFDSYCLNASDVVTYAEGSIMHYPPTAFSANGQPTIRSLRGLDNLMGQRNGYGPTDVSTVNQLYPGSASPWAARASMPTARKQFATGGVSGVLYAIGGSSATGSTVLTRVEAYNPSTNTWSTKADLPSARWRTNGAATISGLLYVAGGVGAGTAGHAKTLFAYKATTNTWSTKAAMPVKGGCGGSSAIAGILFVFIGCDSTTSNNSGAKGILLRYDPVANTWSTKARAPTAHQYPGVTTIGGLLYVVGGKNSSGATRTELHAYNPGTNTWATKAALPAARSNLILLAMAGKLYAVGGNDAAGTFMNTTYVYDPATNAWSTAASMPTARAGLGGTTMTGVLYAWGGYNSSAAALSTNETFIP
jgi:N-acetylneuraminic acid mutarotase